MVFLCDSLHRSGILHHQQTSPCWRICWQQDTKGISLPCSVPSAGYHGESEEPTVSLLPFILIGLV